MKIRKSQLKNIIRQTLNESAGPDGNTILKMVGLSYQSLPEVELGQPMPKIKSFSINPIELGRFAPAFVSINCDIKGARFTSNGIKGAVVYIDYRYSHPSGSNGITVRLESQDDGKSWKVYS